MLDWGERREKQGKEKREKAETKNKKLKIEKKVRKNIKMNSIINAMTKYDHRQHELSDWLLELEQ